jgi:hypothetical protein
VNFFFPIKLAVIKKNSDTQRWSEHRTLGTLSSTLLETEIGTSALHSNLAIFIQKTFKPGVVAHTCVLSPREAEAGVSWVRGQPGLQSETLPRIKGDRTLKDIIHMYENRIKPVKNWWAVEWFRWGSPCLVSSRPWVQTPDAKNIFFNFKIVCIIIYKYIYIRSIFVTVTAQWDTLHIPVRSIYIHKYIYIYIYIYI